jgi:hypothetical protein
MIGHYILIGLSSRFCLKFRQKRDIGGYPGRIQPCAWVAFAARSP